MTITGGGAASPGDANTTPTTSAAWSTLTSVALPHARRSAEFVRDVKVSSIHPRGKRDVSSMEDVRDNRWHTDVTAG
jgi:hypothetical protein